MYSRGMRTAHLLTISQGGVPAWVEVHLPGLGVYLTSVTCSNCLPVLP